MTTRGTKTFNTPLEAGLRTLLLLASTGRRAVDTQRLVYFDYLLVHSGDLGGPESLHPSTPSQGSELLVRRALVQDGIALMRSRDLVERKFQRSGITYAATLAGRHVAAEFASEYAALLRERAEWVVRRFAALSDKELSGELKTVLPGWDDEIIMEDSTLPAEHVDG